MNNKQRIFAIEILAEAYKAKLTTGLPASILASQCILETGWGKKIPICRITGKFSYNLFGIKGKGNNGSVEIITHEYYNGEKVKVKDKFAAYNSYADSFIAYGNLILGAKRYKKALLVKDNPKQYIYEIWKAGYATDINYPEKIIAIAKGCRFIN